MAPDILALRLSGHLTAAMMKAGEALQSTPGDLPLMAETVRLLILTQQTEIASNLYQNLSAAGAGKSLEQRALVRLALQLDRWDLLEEMPTPEGPSWLVTALTKHRDPVGAILPHGVKVSVANGPSIFHFASSCPHCTHALEVVVPVSLLVCRDWICPACFGLLNMNHHGVRSCLKNSFADLLQMDAIESDAEVVEFLRPKLMGAETMENIARSMGQEYHFMINEILLGFLNSGDEDQGGAA